MTELKITTNKDNFDYTVEIKCSDKIFISNNTVVINLNMSDLIEWKKEIDRANDSLKEWAKNINSYIEKNSS